MAMEDIRNTVPPQAYPDGFLQSADYYVKGPFDGISEKWILDCCKEHLPWICVQTHEFMKKRPTLDQYATPQYISAMALRESFELQMAHLAPKTPLDAPLELGDTLFYLTLLSQKMDDRHILELLHPDEVLDMPNDELGRLDGRFQHDGLLAKSQLISATIYYLDRSLGSEAQISENRVKIAKPYLGYAFNLLFRYAAVCDWDPRKIIEKTVIKNNNHYPAVFFEKETTPFLQPSDAIAALRLLRKYNLLTTSKSKAKKSLHGISKNSDEDTIEARILLEKANW